MDNSSQFWLTVVQGAAAIGTLVVAIVAIWGDYFRFLVASPKLAVAIRSPEGELVAQSDDSRARYYHLIVSNSRRWAPARNVAVLVTRIDKLGPHGSWLSEGGGNPVPLMWQFGRHLPGDLPIGAERICDLGCVVKERFALSTQFLPYTFGGSLEKAGKLRCEVRARADNAESAPLTIEVAWDGEWADGDREMSKHLVVSVVAS